MVSYPVIGLHMREAKPNAAVLTGRIAGLSVHEITFECFVERLRGSVHHHPLSFFFVLFWYQAVLSATELLILRLGMGCHLLLVSYRLNGSQIFPSHVSELTVTSHSVLRHVGIYRLASRNTGLASHSRLNVSHQR